MRAVVDVGDVLGGHSHVLHDEVLGVLRDRDHAALLVGLPRGRGRVRVRVRVRARARARARVWVRGRVRVLVGLQRTAVEVRLVGRVGRTSLSDEEGPEPRRLDTVRHEGDVLEVAALLSHERYADVGSRKVLRELSLKVGRALGDRRRIVSVDGGAGYLLAVLDDERPVVPRYAVRTALRGAPGQAALRVCSCSPHVQYGGSGAYVSAQRGTPKAAGR